MTVISLTDSRRMIDGRMFDRAVAMAEEGFKQTSLVPVGKKRRLDIYVRTYNSLLIGEIETQSQFNEMLRRMRRNAL